VKPKVRNRPGRPTKKTEDRAVIILRALENGATRRAAAAIGGIGETAFYSWMETDASFAKSVEQAQGAYLLKVGQAALKHPASAVKWAMMLGRDDKQLQPVQDKIAVDVDARADIIHIQWDEPPHTPDESDA